MAQQIEYGYNFTKVGKELMRLNQAEQQWLVSTTTEVHYISKTSQ